MSYTCFDMISLEASEQNLSLMSLQANETQWIDVCRLTSIEIPSAELVTPAVFEREQPEESLR